MVEGGVDDEEGGVMLRAVAWRTRVNDAVARTPMPWWTGLPFTIATAAAWIALAVNTPTTTYHFAPAVVAAAWPVARRLRLEDRLPARVIAVSIGGGAAFAIAVTVELTLADALAGPTFFGPGGAVKETWVMAGLGSLIGLVFALKPARAEKREDSAESKEVTRSGSG